MNYWPLDFNEMYFDHCNSCYCKLKNLKGHTPRFLLSSIFSTSFSLLLYLSTGSYLHCMYFLYCLNSMLVRDITYIFIRATFKQVAGLEPRICDMSDLITFSQYLSLNHKILLHTYMTPYVYVQYTYVFI